jgi:hydroxymethylglutaryl-CoA lyase
MAKPKIEFVEVSPRDGLQNEPEIVSTDTKLALIDLILKAGFRRLEAGSFVNPKKVPQMADTPDVFERLPDGTGATFIALALNPKGLERAIAAKAREVNYVFCASDGFSIRNNGAPVDETLSAWPEVSARAKGAGVRISATISTAFGCPFDGEVAVAQLTRVAERIGEEKPFELALADTIGVAAPTDVKERFAAVRAAIPPDIQLRAHFHNTRNTALANAAAAVETGVAVLDGSLAGIGGCPFAPGAAGNVPTEDLLYMFGRMGFDTGVDLDAAIEAARFIGQALGKPTPGMVSRAGPFPRKAPPRGLGAAAVAGETP